MKQPRLPKLQIKLRPLGPEERKELRRQAWALLTHRSFKSREWYRVPPKAGHKPDHYLVARRVGLKRAFRIEEYVVEGLKNDPRRLRNAELDRKIYTMAEVVERFNEFDERMRRLNQYTAADAVRPSAKGSKPLSSISPHPGP